MQKPLLKQWGMKNQHEDEEEAAGAEEDVVVAVEAREHRRLHRLLLVDALVGGAADVDGDAAAALS